jgi:hypothetical protein
MEVSGQLYAPTALPPGKDSVVPIGKEAVYLTTPILTHILPKLNITQPKKSVLKEEM